MKKTKLLLMSLFTVGILSLPVKAYAWQGYQDGTGTHAVLTNQAVQMLNNDLNQNESQKVKDNLQILNQYIGDLKLGSTYPDFDPNGWKMYQDHFWDPDTGYNYTHTATWYTSYTVTDTADSQARKFAALALNEWKKGDYKQAEFLLGEATHYVGDLNCPYHAANVTNIDTLCHGKYEDFAEKNKEKYLINTMGCTTKDAPYSDALASLPYSTWITQNDTYWGKLAKNLYFTKSTPSNSWDDWNYSIGQALPNSQKCIAEFLYRFINEASGTITADSSNCDQMQVVIKTANEAFAGTNDYVYFGFETNDGQKYEFNLCNHSHDFAQNQTDTYNITLPKTINAGTITNTWVRKANFTVGGDDWKPENFTLIINSYVNQDVNISSWIKGNATYTMPFDNK